MVDLVLLVAVSLGRGKATKECLSGASGCIMTFLVTIEAGNRVGPCVGGSALREWALFTLVSWAIVGGTGRVALGRRRGVRPRWVLAGAGPVAKLTTTWAGTWG